MIDVEDIPKSGQVLVIAYFKGYKQYLQNESRKILLHSIPAIDKDNQLGLAMSPLLFGILRDVEEGATKSTASRSVGVQYSFSYRNMTPDKYRAFLKELRKRFDAMDSVKNMWSHYEVLLALGVGGV